MNEIERRFYDYRERSTAAAINYCECGARALTMTGEGTGSVGHYCDACYQTRTGNVIIREDGGVIYRKGKT